MEKDLEETLMSNVRKSNLSKLFLKENVGLQATWVNTQLFHCVPKGAIDNIETNEYGCVPIKIYLQNQLVGLQAAVFLLWNHNSAYKYNNSSLESILC